MPDPAEGKSQPDAEQPVLLIVIAADPAGMDDVITALLDIGVTGATVLEGKGLAAVLRDEMPIFAGLGALLPEVSASRVLFAATKRRVADSFFNYLEEELRPSDRPLAFFSPIERSIGLAR